MNRFCLIILTLCLCSAAFSYPVRIQSWNVAEDVKRLNQLQISVDNVQSSSGLIYAELRDNIEFDRLLNNGFNAEKLPDLARENALRLQENSSAEPPRDEYYTITQYNQFMVDTAAQYPSICQLIQFGTSIQGRPLYFLKITDNPSLEEAEPEFKYVSSIHGNEVIGYDMCIRLIQQLTSEYGSNPRITNLVNSTEIWICPMFNPDGFVLGQRYNAAGVDLNRNFPMPSGVQHPDGNEWAPETSAMMEILSDNSFVLSANFHAGALVMNYPWDYISILTPDDALLQEAALAYSTHNLPMYNNPEFIHGITNGAVWYVITGSLQDWNYGFTNCMDITAEIGANMWPPAEQLPSFWAQNQESMLSYLEFMHRGVSGTVNSSSGAPLAASITVQGNDKVIRTDPDVGDYHRMLLPGTYTITASATGYYPQTRNITVGAGAPTIEDFNLIPAAFIWYHGQVRSPWGAPIADAGITIDSDPVLNLQSDAQGLFEFQAYEGNYGIKITSGFGVYRQNIDVLADPLIPNYRNIFIPELPMFTDNFEEGIGNWTVTGTWGLVSEDGSMVLTDSPAGNYANNQTRTARLTTPLDLSTMSHPSLSFRCKYDLEAGYDKVYVEASTTGSGWNQLGSFTGEETDWTNQDFDLSAYAGGNLHLRFRITSDYSVNADGIYIDDLKISGINSLASRYGDVTGDAMVNIADIRATMEYAIGLDPLPDLDPRPWEDLRIEAVDADVDFALDDFDCYLLCKYLVEPTWLLPAETGMHETAADPGLTAHYNGSLVFELANPAELKSLIFSTAPVNLVQVLHNGNHNYLPFVQAFNSATESYGFAGYNTTFISLSATLEETPPSFTLAYSVNGVPGSQFIDTSTAADDPSVPAPVFSLAQNYPNPFNPSTTIRFSLDSAQPASLRIYNSRGQLVRTLVDGVGEAGPQLLVWDGRDDSGNALGSGIYLYRLSVTGKTETRKMILIK